MSTTEPELDAIFQASYAAEAERMAEDRDRCRVCGALDDECQPGCTAGSELVGELAVLLEEAGAWNPPLQVLALDPDPPIHMMLALREPGPSE